MDVGDEQTTTFTGRLLALPDKLYAALTDPQRERSAIVFVLLGFTALWTGFGVLSHLGHDVHYDVGEALGRWSDPFAHYHPPMEAWIVGAWFAVFPQADWASYLLVSVTAAIALLFAWLLMGDWLDGTRRVAGLAMLTLIPFYGFIGGKPNANTLMMPFWAAATLFFLRAIARQSIAQAVLTGVALAGAMWTKYWTVYLAAGFGLAAIAERRRFAHFRSPVSWVAAGVSLLLLLPLALVVLRGETGLHLSAAGFVGGPDVQALARSMQYLGGVIAYASPALIMLAALRPSRAALADTMRPSTSDRQLIAWLFWIPLLLPALVNLAMPHRLTPLWAYPNWTLLPVVLLGSPLLLVSRRAATYALTAAVAIPIAAVIAAPAIGLWQFQHASKSQQEFYRLAAEAIAARWRETTDRPLRFLPAEPQFVWGVAFYLPGTTFLTARERSDPRSNTLSGNGMAMACPMRDGGCMSLLDTLQKHGGTRSEVRLSRQLLGFVREEQFVVLVIPPVVRP